MESSPRSKGTHRSVRERRKHGRRGWSCGKGPYKNPVISTTGRERTRGIKTFNLSLLLPLNLLLIPLVCKTQLEAREQESPSGTVCPRLVFKDPKLKRERLTIDGKGQGLQTIVYRIALNLSPVLQKSVMIKKTSYCFVF